MAERLHGEHSWGMAIGITRAPGCSACVVACPGGEQRSVVGERPDRAQRIHAWIRIDRYYSGGKEKTR